jgi:oligopeptide/dipeptide ABC transporter ATP-binding protein
VTPTCEGRGVTVRTTKTGTLLVDDVSLAVDGGAMLGIVGETGAGKTVTARALLGLLPTGLRAEGELVLGDTRTALGDVGALRALLGSQTSVVLQNPIGMLDPLMRVGPQLVEGVIRKKLATPVEARSRATSLLEQMGFTDVDRVMALYPHELSGGMAQRVVTAMGLMPRPRLLVLDEPTSALDANVRVEVLRLFSRLAAEEGTAVVLVSHDLGLVSHFCSTVSVIYAGRVVERGPTEAIVRRPAHPYTVALLDASATLMASRRVPLAAIGGAPPTPGRWPSGCVFAPRCPHARAQCRDERPDLTGASERQYACHFPRTQVAVGA